MPWLVVRGFGVMGPDVLGCSGYSQGHGFWPFSGSSNDGKALLMALTERWSTNTWNFHLPVGEIRVPPIDFFMMTRLSMDGTHPQSLEDFDADLITRCIGTQSVVYYKGMKGVLPLWFENEYIWAINVSTLAEKAFSTWAFLLYMLTRSIFYGKSDRVYFYFLPALKDLDLVATQSWGRSALRWMYLNMSEILAG